MNASEGRSANHRARLGSTSGPWVLVITGLALLGVTMTRHGTLLSAKDAVPTYSEDVAPILFKNCTSCHRPGGLGPFSLMDYDGAREKINKMRAAVSTGAMPPWHAEGPHDTFRNDRRLSDADKETILRWIDGGAKEGDVKTLPPRPVYPAGWDLGTPDAVVTMPEEFSVPASGTVEYQYFDVPANFTEDKWVQAIEIKPGAREVVHHVLVFARVPPPAAAAVAGVTAPAIPVAGRTAPIPPTLIRNRAQDIPPDAPRRDTLHAPPRQIGALIGTTAPGTNLLEFPAGTALRVRAGTVLTFQMHYTASGHAMHDRSSVGFRFAKQPPDEEIRANQFFNGALVLPAGQRDIAVPAEIGFGEPVRLWGLFPHTHLRGTRWQYRLERPDGTSEMILDVPRYDFNWQTYYLFAKPLEVPAGSKIVSMAWYDNSASMRNTSSNLDVSKDVKWGDQTWEEMQYTGFLYSVNRLRLKPVAP